jgi:putative colanic acid biosynthesis UDP-glucose lipid carrier transferase
MQQGYLRSNQRLLGFIQIMLDATIVCTSFLLAYSLYQGSIFTIPKSYSIVMLIGTGIFYVIAMNVHLYHSWRTDQLYRHLSRLTKAWLLTIVILLMLAWALKVSEQFSRVVIGAWFFLAPVFLALSRWLLRLFLGYIRTQGRNVRFIAVVGDTAAAASFVEELHANEWMGYKVQGRYAKHADAKVDDVKYQGDFQQLVSDVKNRRFDEVFIALPMSEEAAITQLISDLSDSSTPVHIIPDLFTFNLMNARMTRIGNMPTISVFDSPHDDLSAALKRTEDIVLASIILLLISPLMLLIAIAVKLTSPGAVFFKQRRYGVGGEEISVWKFRSMTVCEDGDNVPQAKKNDSRITPLGHFLRKTSLDELPQFFNVLQGQMSIVGPRPHAVAHNELYRKNIHGYMLRHLVKPGITGWAQVNGWRGETDTLEKMEKRIEHDLEYIQNWSIFFDLKIIALTIIKGFINKNAY